MAAHARNPTDSPRELVAVYESFEDANLAKQRLLDEEFHAGAIIVLQEEDALATEKLEVVRRPPSRSTRMAIGLVVGLVLGAWFGWQFLQGQIGSVWASTLLGGVLGVLWGVTIAGLAFYRVKDDRQFQIEKHLKNGRAVLLVTGARETVERALQVLNAEESNGPLLTEPEIRASA